MQKFIVPAILAAAFACMPSLARAGDFRLSIYQGGYSLGNYAPPVYSGYTQGTYIYAPPVYSYPQSYYVVPSYQYAPYSGYSSYYPQHRNEWHGHDRDRHEWREEHDHHEQHRR